MSSGTNENDVKNSLWYQQHLEKLKNKSKNDTNEGKTNSQPTEASQTNVVTSTVRSSGTEVSLNAETGVKSPGLPLPVPKPDGTNPQSGKESSVVTSSQTSTSKTSGIQVNQNAVPVTNTSSGTPLSVPKPNGFNSQPGKESPLASTSLTLTSKVTGNQVNQKPGQAMPFNLQSGMGSSFRGPSPGPLPSLLSCPPPQGPRNSLVITSTVKQSGISSDVKDRISAELEKINSKHASKCGNRVFSGRASTVGVEKSTAYLEHLKRLKEKAYSGKTTDSSKLHNPGQNATSGGFYTPQSVAYREHLRKLQEKRNLSENSFKNQLVYKSGTSLQSIGTISPITTVKTEGAGERTPNKHQAERRNLVSVKTEVSSAKEKKLASVHQSKMLPRSEGKTIPTHTTAPNRPGSDRVLRSSRNESCRSEERIDLPVSDEEEFVTLDYVGEESGEEHTQISKLSTEVIINSTYCKELPKSDEKRVLKSILKRSHDTPNFEPNSAKISRPDSETRIKPNLAIPEQEPIEVLPRDARSNMELDNALAVGLEFIQPISGYHCTLCHTFYRDYPTALHHCTLLSHKMKAIKEQC